MAKHNPTSIRNQVEYIDKVHDQMFFSFKKKAQTRNVCISNPRILSSNSSSYQCIETNVFLNEIVSRWLKLQPSK